MKVDATTAVAGVALLAVGLLAWAGARQIGEAAQAVGEVVGGLVTGHNTFTENATNMDGERTNAYEGAGPVGTLGAVVNEATGGATATLGEYIGGKLWDWTHPSQSTGTTWRNKPEPAGDTEPGAPLWSWDYFMGA